MGGEAFGERLKSRGERRKESTIGRHLNCDLTNDEWWVKSSPVPTPISFYFLNVFHLFIYCYLRWQGHGCHDAHVEVRGQLFELFSPSALCSRSHNSEIQSSVMLWALVAG